MSALPLSSLAPAAPTGLSAIDQASGASEPESVRAGSKAVKQAYASAQGFEEMLLQQLSQSLAQSSGLSGESESGEEGSPEGNSEAGSSMLSSMLPQTLTEGVMREGGLGLAGQLMSDLDPSASAAAPAASLGVAGPTGGASA
jgi:Rod binding domain-containing protein